jgi:nucleolar MIF4G domain-containing protein 1
MHQSTSGSHYNLVALAQVTLLSACGLQLRNADPAAMKAWVMAIHERAAEVRASAPPAAAPPEAKAGAKGAATGGRPQAQAPAPAGQPQPPAGSSSSSSGAGGLSKRAQLMLELVIDIKNNKWVVTIMLTEFLLHSRPCMGDVCSAGLP